MWAYDRQQGKCVRFWYGSCEGNGNRFETEQECQETCISPKGIGMNIIKENDSIHIQKFFIYFLLSRSMLVTKNGWTMSIS